MFKKKSLFINYQYTGFCLLKLSKTRDELFLDFNFFLNINHKSLKIGYRQIELYCYADGITQVLHWLS